MKPAFEYKGYLGSAEVSLEDNILHGKLLYITDVISYAADSPKELEAAFRTAVDEYLETCEECGDEPNVPFKGVFNVRLGPELHRACALAAEHAGTSLNDWVKGACQAKIDRPNGDVQEKKITVILQNQANAQFDETDFAELIEADQWPVIEPAQAVHH